MEIRHLRTFLTVADTLNISEGARRLRVTQPALSRQIQDLEHSVGHALFYRRRGRLQLTATGIKLREHGSKALASMDEAMEIARGTGRTEKTELRIGYIGSVGMWASIVMPAVKRLQSEFDHVAPLFSEGSSAELVSDLREGRLDVAVLGPGDAGRMPGIVSTLVGTVAAEVMLPADHRFAKKREISLGDLRDEVVISFARHLVPGRDRTLTDCCRAAGFKPRIKAVATGMEDLILAVSNHAGIAFVTPFARSAPHPGVIITKLKSPAVMLDAYVACSPKAGVAAHRLAELFVAGMRRALSAIRRGSRHD